MKRKCWFKRLQTFTAKQPHCTLELKMLHLNQCVMHHEFCVRQRQQVSCVFIMLSIFFENTLILLSDKVIKKHEAQHRPVLPVCSYRCFRVFRHNHAIYKGSNLSIISCNNLKLYLSPVTHLIIYALSETKVGGKKLVEGRLMVQFVFCQNANRAREDKMHVIMG